jgi:hypothetical protein
LFCGVCFWEGGAGTAGGEGWRREARSGGLAGFGRTFFREYPCFPLDGFYNTYNLFKLKFTVNRFVSYLKPDQRAISEEWPFLKIF